MNSGGSKGADKQRGGGDLFDRSFDPKWLPGSPHREAILEFLADGRAHVEQRGHLANAQQLLARFHDCPPAFCLVANTGHSVSPGTTGTLSDGRLVGVAMLLLKRSVQLRGGAHAVALGLSRQLCAAAFMSEVDQGRYLLRC